jgi:hypothetical protein
LDREAEDPGPKSDEQWLNRSVAGGCGGGTPRYKTHCKIPRTPNSLEEGGLSMYLTCMAVGIVVSYSDAGG